MPSQNIDFFDFSHTHREHIEERIIFHIQQMSQQYFTNTDMAPMNIEQLLQKYLCGGKMWRASLTLYMMEAFINDSDKSNELNKYFDIAIAIEFLQAFLLVHDDIMDDDDMRRGQPSIHISFQNIIANADSSEQKNKKSIAGGKALAICLGDILLSYTFEILSQYAHISSLIKQFAKHISIVGVGQMSDVYWSSLENPNIRSIEILSMYEMKTGAYTFSLPFILGYLIAQHVNGNDENDIEQEQLDTLGKQLGVIFQVQDDLIGATYSTEITGKPQGSDFKEKKYTYLFALLLEKLQENGNDMAILQSIMDGEIGDKEVQEILKLCQKHGIGRDIKNILSNLVHGAHISIDGLSIREEYKQPLKELGNFLISRNK